MSAPILNRNDSHPGALPVKISSLFLFFFFDRNHHSQTKFFFHSDRNLITPRWISSVLHQLLPYSNRYNYIFQILVVLFPMIVMNSDTSSTQIIMRRSKFLMDYSSHYQLHVLALNHLIEFLCQL